MALTTPPTTVAPFDEGYLSAGIGPTDTTIYVGPIYKTVNGVKTQQGFNSTAGLAVITQGDKTERVSFESISVDATTKVTTLSSCTRGLSVTSTSASYSAGTGCTFTKGARIQVVDDVAYNQAAAYTAKANTFTQAQTITAPVTVTGTSSYIAPPSMTTAQREALSGSPKIVYDTDLGQIYQNIGGAWAAVGDTGTPTASEAAEGKVELATVAEHVAATTGARVVQAKNCANNATDAAENKVVTLDSAKTVAPALGGTGVISPTAKGVLIAQGASPMTVVAPGTSGNVLRSNGTDWASAAPAASTNFTKVVLLSTTSSTELSNPTSATIFDAGQYTVPANDLVAGVAYEIEAAGNMTLGTSHTTVFSLFWGGSQVGNAVVTLEADSGSAVGWVCKFTLFGTAAAGAAAATKHMGSAFSSQYREGTTYYHFTTVNLATNADKAIGIGFNFGGSNAAHRAQLHMCKITKISTTAF